LSATLGQATVGLPAALSVSASAPTGFACRFAVRSIRTTGQKYEDLSPLRQVVPEAARLSSLESAVIDRLPTKSCTCWAPLRIPGCATGLSGLNFPFSFLPQSTVNTPVEAPRRGGGAFTFGATCWIGTKLDSGAASANALPLRALDTIPAVTAAVAASTTSTATMRNSCDRVRIAR
jgi:hypothetical protein